MNGGSSVDCWQWEHEKGFLLDAKSEFWPDGGTTGKVIGIHVFPIWIQNVALSDSIPSQKFFHRQITCFFVIVFSVFKIFCKLRNDIYFFLLVFLTFEDLLEVWKALKTRTFKIFPGLWHKLENGNEWRKWRCGWSVSDHFLCRHLHHFRTLNKALLFQDSATFAFSYSALTVNAWLNHFRNLQPFEM